MAMLAERRRKAKFVLTPKSKPLWTSESNGIQFGKKLMEKMGWSAGKGLGALGQGIQEPLRQAFKQDTKGMGYSGDGNPFENLDQFNALLSSLTGEEASEPQTFESLEQKSKSSKSRVHYKKFTRGKDLANYSSVDLSCIVGSGKKQEVVAEIEEIVDRTGETENSHGVTTINSGSIADYFKLKMDMKKVGEVDSDRQHKKKREIMIEEEDCVIVGNEKSASKKKKKKKKDENLESLTEELEVDETADQNLLLPSKKKKKEEITVLDLESEVEILEPTKSEKKKKAKTDQPGDIESIIENNITEIPADGIEIEIIEEEKTEEIQPESEENLDTKKSKEKKKVKKIRSTENDCIIENAELLKKEKKKKTADGVEIEIIEQENAEEIQPGSQENLDSKKPKKKKKEKTRKNECIIENTELTEKGNKKTANGVQIEIIEEKAEEIQPQFEEKFGTEKPKKKQKIRTTDNECIIENPELTKKEKKKKIADSIEIEIIEEKKVDEIQPESDENLGTKKSKKKKKEKIRTTENDCIIENTELTKKEKKKKKTSTETELENENCQPDIVLIKLKKKKRKDKDVEISQEEIPKKKKKRKNDESEEVKPEMIQSNENTNETEPIETDFLGANLNSLPGYGKQKKTSKFLANPLNTF